MNEATIAKKVQEVEAVNATIANAGSTLFVDYLGLTVAEVTELRVKLHAENCEMKVVKNNILRRATAEEGFASVESYLVGPSAIITGTDEVTAAKILAKFIKENKKGEILGAVLEGKVLSADEAKQLASMPTKEELYAKILGSINSPASGIVYSINGVMAALTRAIAAVRDQKSA